MIIWLPLFSFGCFPVTDKFCLFVGSLTKLKYSSLSPLTGLTKAFGSVKSIPTLIETVWLIPIIKFQTPLSGFLGSDGSNPLFPPPWFGGVIGWRLLIVKSIVIVLNPYLVMVIVVLPVLAPVLISSPFEYQL